MKRRRMKAARCQLCRFRLLDRESLLCGEGHHAVFCALTRSAVILYVAAWPSGDRFRNAAFMLDQATAESPLWALAPPQQWRRL